MWEIKPDLQETQSSGRHDPKSHREGWGEMFWSQMLVVAAQLCEHTEHCAVHVKRVTSKI